MSKTFENKVVLITGGTTGIGRATAIAFAEEGATVVISGRRNTEGTETVTHIEKAGGKGLFIQSDVSDEGQVEALVDSVLKKFGRLDVAVNNAGIEGTPTPLIEATVEQYEKVFNINVKGVFLSMKYEIPAMLKTGGGSIVNTSSAAGSNGFPSMGLYVGTKHAVNGLTKTAALEYARQGIRVNTVSPAGVETDMLQRFVGKPGEGESEARKGFTETHPVGRVGTPEEIAAAILFLSAPTSGFITGHDLLVDGGYSAK